MAGPVAADVSAPVDASQVGSEAAAREIAEEYGHNVVVESLSSPTMLVSARPDGYLEAVSSQGPEQAKVGGRWKPIDTTLVEKDGRLEPKVAAVPVRIGTGGDSTIVSVRAESGDWITETWPHGDLPKPIVKKAAATFREVLPGVDLRVSVTKAGMREVLVVKNAEAATDERVASLRLAVRGARLATAEETGALEAHTDGGEPIVASTPLWWDSSHASADADSSGAVEPQAVASTVEGSETVLDVAAIAEGDVTYPLYVDPDWTRYAQASWYTDLAYPGQSYLNAAEHSAGYALQDGVDHLSRAFFRFDTSSLAGRTILSARFNVVQTWASSCASTMMQLWQYGGSSAGFSWNSDPGQWVKQLDQQGYDVGGSCQPNPAWVGYVATAAVQDTAAARAEYTTLALRAADEGNPLTRKRYRSDAQLIVVYNTRPEVPTEPKMTSPARECNTNPQDPAYVYGRQPLTLSVVVHEQDDQNVSAAFYVKRVSTGSQTRTGTGFFTRGTSVTHTIAADSLVDGELYAWAAESGDGIELSAGTSPWCYFVVDSTKPALPTVTLDDTGARIGEALTATITPPAGEAIAGYQVWWTKGKQTTPSPAAPVIGYTSAMPDCTTGRTPNDTSTTVRIVCSDQPDGSATTLVAPIDRTSTLWVAAYDRAGNVSYDAATKSAAAGVQVGAAGADVSGGRIWEADESDVTQLDDRNGGVPIAIGTNAGWTTSDDEAPQLRFQGLTTLSRYWKPGAHLAETGGVDDYVLEGAIGQLARFGPGSAQPAGTGVLYACAFGAGNMISRSPNCEGTGAAARVLGYTWSSADAMPAGYAAKEIFRCRLGDDYFISAHKGCETGAVDEGSQGFLVSHTPTSTDPGVVDTSRSFTVSARVKPGGSSEAQTFVSASGSVNAGFYLQNGGTTWQFCLRAQGPTPSTGCVRGPSVSTTEFSTVSGRWDAVNKRLSIAVVSRNGTDVREAIYVPPVDDVPALGAIALGSAASGAVATQFFDGQIGGVSFYPAVLPDGDLETILVPKRT